MKPAKFTNLCLVVCVLFVLSSTGAIAQTNDSTNLPPFQGRGQRRAAKGDELENVTAMFKKDVERDRLPGLPAKSDFELKANMNDAKDSVSFEARPKNNDFVYHYEYNRAATGKRAWKLKKAWRTDKENHVKEYPVD